MAKLILHTEANIDSINDRRLSESFALTHRERMKKAFELMKLALLFKKNPIKNPQGKGIVLKF